MKINEKRLIKLADQIYNLDFLKSDEKQPMYTLIGNRLLNCAHLPVSLGDKGYKDLVDRDDKELFRRVYETIKPDTLRYYVGESISETKLKNGRVYIDELSDYERALNISKIANSLGDDFEYYGIIGEE